LPNGERQERRDRIGYGLSKRRREKKVKKSQGAFLNSPKGKKVSVAGKGRTAISGREELCETNILIRPALSAGEE